VRKAINSLHLVKPSIVICVPTDITQVEKRAVIDAATLAGVASISLVEEPMAVALAADIPFHYPLGNMVLDIGRGNTGGTSEVAASVASTQRYVWLGMP
jgi:rod shape-determining protein MreB